MKLPLNNNYLSTTATNFGFRGWSFNTVNDLNKLNNRRYSQWVYVIDILLWFTFDFAIWEYQNSYALTLPKVFFSLYLTVFSCFKSRKSRIMRAFCRREIKTPCFNLYFISLTLKTYFIIWFCLDSSCMTCSFSDQKLFFYVQFSVVLYRHFMYSILLH